MSIKYKFSEYTIAYGQEYIIDSPIFTDSNAKFSLGNFTDVFKINENDGSIFISSNVCIGIYNLNVLSQDEKVKLKISIKPNITYKIPSFYNNNEYLTYLPITNPPNLSGEYKLEEKQENINIDNKTGEISFNDNISAGTYNLVVKCIIKNIEQTCITTFNIYPIVKYENETYYCEKWDLFKSDIPFVKPIGGVFKFNIDYTGVFIDNLTGEITISKPKSGCYNLIVVYKVNNISINTNISLYIKPIITYEKSITEYKNLMQFNAPTNTDVGGIYKLDQTPLNKNLSINSTNGKITIKNPIPTGLYYIQVLYSYNNYTSQTIFELSITPNIYYVNNKVEILFGTKYQSEKIQSTEEINGSFSLTKTYENIHINPNNGILYISNYLDCNDYNIDINYNKNNINKIITFNVKVKPIIELKNAIKQEINYYDNLNNIIVETNPKGGVITNNLGLQIENSIIKLSEFEKKIGNYELKLKYVFNNISNFVTYNFCILPYIIYNNNNINILFKQNYTSEIPTTYPYDGTFFLETKINNVKVDEKTGKIIVNSGINIGVYELIIGYKCLNDLISKTNFKLTIKPIFDSNKNNLTYIHNPFPKTELHNLDPINVSPKGGIFSTDNFKINENGIISIPSDLTVGEYKINIKYSYFDINTCFDCTLNVLPYKISCLFKYNDKIYDGTDTVTLKYIITNDYKLTLSYDASFDNKYAGYNKKIEIKNIKVLDNINIIHDDTIIYGIIKKRKLDIDFKSISKFYDGLLDADIEYKINNIIPGDNLFIKSYNCKYDSPFVGKNKIIITNIILGGNDSNNYVTENSYEIFGIIKPCEAYVKFKSPIIEYTGSTSVNLEIESIEGVCNDDNIIIESYFANFENPNVGENIPISVKNIKQYKNFNYNLLQKPLFGKIIKKEFLLNAVATNKIYDGTNSANITFINNNIKILSYQAYYEDKNVGYKKIIFINNIVSDNPNYNIKDIIIYGSIVPLNLIVKYYGENKIFDGTQDVNGEYEIINKILNDDIEVLSTIIFDDCNAGNNKNLISRNNKILGNDCNNYNLNNIILNKPHIYKKKIEIEFIGINKTYDNTTNANVKVNIVNKNIKVKSYSAFFENKDVGNNKKIIISDIVLLNDNYYCETTYAYANIEKKQVKLVVEPIQKEYNGNVDTDIKIINIIGICFNDNMYITNYKAEFNDPNVGNNKTVKISNIEYGGISCDNYYCEDFLITSTINKKKIVFEVLNNEKYFDGNTHINITLKSQNNIIVKSFSANFDNSNIGNNKNIYVKNIVLDNEQDINNYLVTDFICYGNILPTYLNIKFTAKNKIFDSTNKAIVYLTENYKIKYEAQFEDYNVGNNKKIIVKILEGTVPNFLLYETYITYGNILPIEIKINPIIKSKIFNELTTHAINFEISNNEVLEYVAEFENCNVGNNKKLLISKIKLKDENYYCRDFYTTGNIVPLAIDMNFTIQPKIYDGTTKALIENNIGISYYEACFLSPNIGRHDVNIKNVVLQNKNYVVNDCVVQSEILQKLIPITIIINEKEYDGTRNATIKSYNSDYNVKIIDYNAKFDNELIEENKKVYITNIKFDNNNYTCDNIITISKITKRKIEINFKDLHKFYDGTTNTNLEIIDLINVINNENVNVSSYKSQYLNKTCGDTLLILSNIILSGSHCENYVIEKIKIPAKIIKRKLKYVINVTDKKYDGNNYAFINIVLNNILQDEDVYIENFMALYDNEQIGTNKEIKISNIYLGGKDKNNYEIDNEVILYGNIY